MKSHSLLSLFLSLLIFSLSFTPLLASDSHFEGFDAEDDVVEDEPVDLDSLHRVTDLPLTQSESTSSPPITTTTTTTTTNLDSPDPQSDPDPNPNPNPTPTSSDPQLKPSAPTTSFDYWDEDEFEGLPVHQQPQLETPAVTESAASTDQTPDTKMTEEAKNVAVLKKNSYTVEIVCVTFLIMFIINYFTGKRENENLALAWATKFATKNSIFEKNFSLLGVGEGDDSPLLLKEGQNVFKFYASGRRYCSGLLATMELKGRHDLISRFYNLVVPCKDEITFEVYMNDDSMDHVVFAMAKKKTAKTMQKEVRDLNKFAGLITAPPAPKKWVVEDLGVVSESREVAGDLITEAVLDQVFGDKAFEKYGKGFISMHFSDQHPGTHRKMLLFKFALPDANNIGDMSRLVALVPYYIDLIGRYKLSPQARSKTEAARQKAAQEAYKELQNARQEALQKKKAERRKMVEEAEAKLSAEAIRRKDAKERARQMKKGMPRVKMTRAH
ncbi:uncharacterized protein At5g49945-like isoform X2 [Pistacia vera]|uniref:uncharacterized protein At5g49945-like isoform X2 n=1 Tax=Pistacia vera TaxID=55513 RepID=UPI001263A490|nr:uncharacterized protein At5g49945-like isoform X2 [Pistacia vera]